MDVAYWIWICSLGVTNGSYPRYMVKPKFDVIVVMPRGDLLSLLSFELSVMYTHFFGIENGDLNFFINHLEFLQ